MRRFALASLLLALALAACGGGDGGRDEARALYRDYRAAQDKRGDAEERLRQAFVDIADAAANEDRADVRAAAARGEEAAAEIDRLLALEVKAAAALASVDGLAEPARRLERGLTTSREGLALVVRELAIARRDPLLERRANEREIRRLARAASDVSQRGELARRKADIALAAALDVEPPVDPVLGSGSA